MNLNKYAGLKIIGFRADDTACGVLRVQYPLEYLARQGADVRVVTKVNFAECMAADYIIAQRQYSEGVIDMLLTLKDMGKTIVYEVDDDLHAVHITSPAFRVYKQGTKELKNATRMIENSDGLTVSTPELAAEYYRYNRNTFVIPNCIDFDIRNWTTRVESRDPAITILWAGGTCYTPDTEVLTDNGFKFFTELLPEDKVATLNPDTWNLEYQLPTEYINVPYSGQILQADTDHVSYAVTPNHWMYVAGKTRTKPTDFSSTQASALHGRDFYCKKDAIWAGQESAFFVLPEATVSFKDGRKPTVYPEKSIPMDDWLKLFGFWVADGYTSHTSSITDDKLYALKHVGFLQFKQPNDMQELKDILTRNNFTITERSSGEFLVCDKQLWQYLNQFGRASKKYIPKDILQLPARQLQILLDWYLKGNGHIEVSKTGTKKITAYTASPRLADCLVEIALKLGLAANVANRGKRSGTINGRTITANHDQYVVSFIGANTSKDSLYPKVSVKSQSSVYYCGTVHCVVVPNHTLYVRRHGKSFWCKNTHQEDMPQLGRVVKAVLARYPEVKFAMCTNPILAKQAIDSWWPQTSSGSSGPPMDRIILLKDVSLDNYPQVLTHGDIGLAPIKNTTFNRCKSQLKLMEYGAWGIPYVASKVAPYQRYIDQGVDGWTVDNDDIDGWVEKVGILIENEATRRTMGQAACDKVHEKFDYAKNLDCWVNAWQDIRMAAYHGNTGTGAVVDTNVGRNDPCPCGATKEDGTPFKYKNHCHPAWG